MPLVIVSGLPCSGKTIFSTRLKAYLEEKYPNYKVCLLNDENLNISKATSYSNSNEEKKARAAFMSAVERSISKDTIVIADSMNYIKGYRYQLFCVSRAANTPHCAVYVLTSTTEAKARNLARSAGYPDAVFDELADRFEEPNNQTKWDNPLFCVSAYDEGFEEICESICTRKAKPPSAATAPRISGSSDLISALDRETQKVVNTIMKQMKPFGPSTVTFEGGDEPLCLTKPIASGTLSSLRRQFIHMNRLHPIELSAITGLFINYIRNTLV